MACFVYSIDCRIVSEIHLIKRRGAVTFKIGSHNYCKEEY